MNDIEVNQEAKLKISQLQIGQNLSDMNWRNLFDGFQFHDDRTLDENVDPITDVKGASLEDDWTRALNFDVQILTTESMREASLVGRLKQTRP